MAGKRSGRKPFEIEKILISSEEEARLMNLRKEARKAREAKYCHVCFIANGGEDVDVFNGKGYHLTCIESPNFGKNGTKDIFDDLSDYHLTLKAKKGKTHKEQDELIRLTKALKRN